MKNVARTVIKTLNTPLGETPLAELKAGDLLGIMDEEVIEPEGIVEEPDIDIDIDIDVDGETVGTIIDMLEVADMDMDLLHPPVIPPIIAPTYRINAVSLLLSQNFYKNIKSVYLKDSRTSNDGVISSGGVVPGEDDIALSRNAVGNSHGELPTTVRHEGRKDGTRDGDKGRKNFRGIHRCVKTRAGHQLDLRAVHDGTVRGCDERREGLHREHAIARWARGNEGCSQGKDLIEVEGIIKRLRRRCFAKVGAQVCAVAGLDGQDAAGGCEVGAVHDGGGSTEIGAHTDTFQDAGKGHEALHVGGWERVVASRNGLGSSS